MDKENNRKLKLSIFFFSLRLFFLILNTHADCLFDELFSGCSRFLVFSVGMAQFGFQVENERFISLTWNQK